MLESDQPLEIIIAVSMYWAQEINGPFEMARIYAYLCFETLWILADV